MLGDIEMRLLVVACRYAISYHDVVPEVGMGYLDETVLRMITDECGFQLTPEEERDVLRDVRN